MPKMWHGDPRGRDCRIHIERLPYARMQREEIGFDQMKTMILFGVLLGIIALFGISPDTTSYQAGILHGGLLGMYLAYVALSIIDLKGEKCTEKPIL
jgi:ABC-type microcin C transport system permease subunit YejE